MLFHYTDQQLGNYNLQHPLGQGNFSEVYLAEHIHTHEQVAIKLLSGRRSGQDAEQFLAQASALTRLRHPHIISVLDFGIEDGIAFLAMTYTPHGTLRQRHPKGTRVPLDTVISYVKQIGDALHYVHQHQIVHRDIKPHNMLLGPNDEVMLSDFGIAIISQSNSPHHAYEHEFEGTAPYAAPEQLQGQSRRSSDQYALAVAVYEWICGEWPFAGSFDEVVHQHLFVPPPPFHQKGITCPSSIEQVVMKALEKDPNKRFSSIKQFADELAWSYTIASARNTHTAASPQPPTQRQFKSPLPFK